MPPIERVFWRSDSPPQAGGAPSTVRVSYDDTGAPVFYGDESAYMGDKGHNYEYAGPDADVLDPVCAHVDEIIARGERSWLDDHGIERGFTSY